MKIILHTLDPDPGLKPARIQPFRASGFDTLPKRVGNLGNRCITFWWNKSDDKTAITKSDHEYKNK